MTGKPKRKAVPDRIKLRVLMRQIGFEPHEMELDHEPPLAMREVNADGTDWVPPQHDETYLIWRPKAEHRRKTSGTKATTAGSDIHKIAKIKRLSREHEEFRRNLLSPEPKSPPEKKYRWPKRGFQSRKMKGATK